MQAKKRMKARIKFNGKEIEIDDIVKCYSFKKFKGLMFTSKEKANALLFDFNGPCKQAIHSLFVSYPFLAIWLNEGKISEFKLVSPNTAVVKPENEFTQLIEIPMNEKYKEVVNLFLS